MSYQNAEPAYSEDAARRAIHEARQKIILHIGATSKELGVIAAQYGNVISNYQKELHQLDAALATLQPPNAFAGYQCNSQSPAPLPDANYSAYVAG